MQLFEPMYESSHCRGEEWSVFGVWFSRFLGRQLANKWLCTTQNLLFCIVLGVRLQHVQFFGKNRQSFAWKCFVLEQLLLNFAHLENPYSRLLFTFGLIRVNPRFITCHDVIDVFQSTPIEFLEHFFRPINTSHFFERLTNCPMRTNFFDNQMFMQYWMYAGPTNA